MKRYALTKAALILALVAGLSASAIPSDASVSVNPTGCLTCVRYDITALIFTPAQPGTMNALLARLNVVAQADDASDSGVYVIGPNDRTSLLKVIREYGTTVRQLHKKIPAGEDGQAGVFSWSSSRHYSARLTARHLEFLKNEPATVALDFSLRAQLGLKQFSSDGTGPVFANSSSVLLPVNGELMVVQQMAREYLIWLITTN